jgi:quinol monooxygenase YgiN
MPRGSFLGMAAAVMLSMAALPVAAQAPAGAPAPAAISGPVYLISFFEIVPAAADKTAPLLGQYAAESRKADGNSGVLALRETTRPGRFALVEVWRDKPTIEARAGALAALGERLRPDIAAPFDTRPNAGLDVAGAPTGAESSASNDAVYVLTHVDVFPAGKDQTVEMLKQLAADSRKEPGNLRFDMLQQEGRLNHLPLIEAWRNAGTHEAHVTAEHTRAYRAKLVKLQGALYDERLYQAVR